MTANSHVLSEPWSTCPVTSEFWPCPSMFKVFSNVYHWPFGQHWEFSVPRVLSSSFLMIKSLTKRSQTFSGPSLSHSFFPSECCLHPVQEALQLPEARLDVAVAWVGLRDLRIPCTLLLIGCVPRLSVLQPPALKTTTRDILSSPLGAPALARKAGSPIRLSTIPKCGQFSLLPLRPLSHSLHLSHQ